LRVSAEASKANEGMAISHEDSALPFLLLERDGVSGMQASDYRGVAADF